MSLLMGLNYIPLYGYNFLCWSIDGYLLILSIIDILANVAMNIHMYKCGYKHAFNCLERISMNKMLDSMTTLLRL